MSGYLFQDVDSIEPIADTLGEMWGNAQLYNVISGCALAYDAANMTVDLGAGAIMHYGSPLQIVAAPNNFTLVSDPTNPRWTWLALDSAGAGVVVSGTAAATPTVPELGDRVALALLLVQAGQTIAANVTYKIDKRLPNPQGLIGYWGTATSTASTSATSLVTISKLGFSDSIPASQGIRIVFNARKQALAASSVGFGFFLNSTTVLEAASVQGFVSSSSNRAESGAMQITIPPRSATYQGWFANGQWVVTSSGAQAIAGGLTNSATAVVPAVAITQLGIRAINDTNSNLAEVTAVYVYAN